MTPDRIIQFLSQQEPDRFPQVVNNPTLLSLRLLQFGEGPEDEQDAAVDSEMAAELAQVYEETIEQAEAVYLALSKSERETLVKAVRATFPPSPDADVEELNQALL